MQSSFVNGIDGVMGAGSGAGAVFDLSLVLNFLFETSAVAFLGILLMVLVFYRHRERLLFSGAVLYGGLLVGYIIKNVIMRIRPSGALIYSSGYSFPSGHTIGATLLLMTIAYLYKDKIKSFGGKIGLFLVSLIVIGLVGFSRVYLGAHFISDVLGGFLFGMFWVNLMAFLFHRK